MKQIKIIGYRVEDNISSNTNTIIIKYKIGLKTKYTKILYREDNNFIAFVCDNYFKLEEEKETRRELLLKIAGYIQYNAIQMKLINEWKIQDLKEQEEQKVKEEQEKIKQKEIKELQDKIEELTNS